MHAEGWRGGHMQPRATWWIRAPLKQAADIAAAAEVLTKHVQSPHFHSAPDETHSGCNTDAGLLDCLVLHARIDTEHLQVACTACKSSGLGLPTKVAASCEACNICRMRQSVLDSPCMAACSTATCIISAAIPYIANSACSYNVACTLHTHANSAARLQTDLPAFA